MTSSLFYSTWSRYHVVPNTSPAGLVHALLHYYHIHKNISLHIKYSCFSFHIKLMCAAQLVLNILQCCLIFVLCSKDTTINAESVNLYQIIFLLHRGHLCVCCLFNTLPACWQSTHTASSLLSTTFKLIFSSSHTTVKAHSSTLVKQRICQAMCLL